MVRVHELVALLFLAFPTIKSASFSSCIPNTSCQCYLTQYSLTLINCSQSLSDLPIFTSKNAANITKIIARNALIQWPNNICKYLNLQILDLSESDFNSESIDLSCLNHLIHLNLTNTKLKQVPIFKKNHLQILDLSNNHIKNINGMDFQSLDNLISLLLHNNPIESIEHLDMLLNLSNIQSINLLSSNLNLNLKRFPTVNQWMDLIHQWNNSIKPFSIRMNNIPFQTLLPNSDLFSSNHLKIILTKFLNSTFDTLFNTPKCNCLQLRKYQNLFSSIENRNKYSSSLFQSTQCLMLDGITHARFFDRRTYIDLRCPLLSKIAHFPFLHNSSSSLDKTLFSLVISCLFFFY